MHFALLYHIILQYVELVMLLCGLYCITIRRNLKYNILETQEDNTQIYDKIFDLILHVCQIYNKHIALW